MTGLSALLMFAACGGSSDNNGTPDAGVDVAIDHFVAPPVDAGIDSPPMVDACTVDADLNNIMFPDAAIGDTGTTTSNCYACTHASCQALLDTCQTDCACKGLVSGLFSCLEADAGLGTCAGGLVGGADTNAQNLGFCVYAGCQKQCGLPSIPEGGVDAPTDSSSDTGSADADDGG